MPSVVEPSSGSSSGGGSAVAGDPVIIVPIEIDGGNGTNHQHQYTSTSTSSSINNTNNNTNNNNNGTLRQTLRQHGRQHKRWVWVFLVGSFLSGVYILQGSWSQVHDPNDLLLHVPAAESSSSSSSSSSSWNWNGNDPPVPLQPGETVPSLQNFQRGRDGALHQVQRLDEQQQQQQQQQQHDKQHKAFSVFHNNDQKGKSNQQQQQQQHSQYGNGNRIMEEPASEAESESEATTTTTATTVTQKPPPPHHPPPPLHLHAAQALQCRAFVVNFVINATDGKDECEGLKKAFDKTCSNDGANSAAAAAGSAASTDAAGSASAGSTDASSTDSDSSADSDSVPDGETVGQGGQQHHERHLQSKNEQSSRGRRKVTMWEKTRRTFRWHAFAYESYRSLQQSLRYVIHYTGMDYYYINSGGDCNSDNNCGDLFFFAEDAVGDAYEDASYLVQNRLDQSVHEDLRRQWRRERVLLDDTEYRQKTQQLERDLQRQQQENQRERERRRRRRQLERELATATNQTVVTHFYNSTHSYHRTQTHRQQVLQQLQQQKRQRRQRQRRHLEESLSFSTTTPATATNKTVAVVRPSANLAMPTSNTHLSESTLSETLMLQQGENLIVKANNQSSHLLEANTDAAASSKAMKESSAAVSALLNDPSSVEARTCCASILNVYHENCSVDAEQDNSDSQLVFVVCVMACCGVVKSLIRHFRILWLPEAAGCILVGVLAGYGIMIFPHNDISFDGNWFLRILVPPIVFEAALGIDKRSFNRHLVPILMYAIVGTLIATVLTAMIVHRGSLLFPAFCSPIPYVEALTFGALISSIDPIAVLSVLSNMGMTDTDTIYVVIFGESLLNDGVAIVLFETLVHFLDENLVIDGEAIFAASIHFLVVAFGSLLVGIGSGMLSTVYYWMFHGCQTAMVEVLMFFCWALLPYYVCDGIGWSGIVSAVATGFVMDLYVVGEKSQDMDHSEQSKSDQEVRFEKETKFEYGRNGIFSGEGHLSEKSRLHIGFVTEMISTAMETAIFAYLGLFLFSHRYHWNFFHTVLAIIACCVSRAVMIPTLSLCANAITRIQQTRAACRNRGSTAKRVAPNTPAGVVIDRKMQIVLWFAGLRGAVSFALVERISLYDSTTGEGTRLKPELKAMTSATIMFTVFILGGYTYYMMEYLGLAPPNSRKPAPSFETKALLNKSPRVNGHENTSSFSHLDSDDTSSAVNKTTFFRQRQPTNANGNADH